MKLEEIADPKGRILAKLKAALQIVEPQGLDLHRLKMIDELTTQLNRLKHMDSRLYEDKLAELITKDMYLEKRNKFATQATEVAGRLELLREGADIAKPIVPQATSASKIVNLYLDGSPQQKRIIMVTLFKPMIARGESVIVSLYGYS